MTEEEIGKATREYAQSLEPIAFENLSGEEIPYLLRGAFKEGLELANKHWREKTRWIPIKERLPEVRDTPYCIAIKYESVASEEEMIGTLYVYDQSDVNYLLLEQITHWKEIE